MDKVFIELLHIVTSNNIVSIHGSYFYEDYSENEFYSFEGMEELLDGLLQLSYGEHHIRMVYFVEKIEQAIRLYKVHPRNFYSIKCFSKRLIPLMLSAAK